VPETTPGPRIFDSENVIRSPLARHFPCAEDSLYVPSARMAIGAASRHLPAPPETLYDQHL
jgi:hypothetical protein